MVRIIEVGPRDGLQNEPIPIPVDLKATFIRALFESGLKTIEATSFVSPKWVPQLGDAAELWPMIAELEPLGAELSALVPNAKGLERALSVGVHRIAVFTSASEAFTLKNINMTIEQSISGFRDVVAQFRELVPNGFIRGYVSTAFECPYAGKISPDVVVNVTQRLLEIGVNEVSLGDTIGVAVPAEVRELTGAIRDSVGLNRIAYHFHDTRGTAIANVSAAYDMGVRGFDSSAAGLGGCPYAPGAGGNLATDDLVYFLERSGVKTGVNLVALAQASQPILQLLGRPPQAKSQLAALAGE